jgi:hypothetical protein
MRTFIKTSLLFFIASFLSACNSNPNKTAPEFENLPDSTAKRYLDSLAWVVDKSIPLRQRGFPINQKEKSYFEERPYFDSSGKLKKVTVYEFRSDTFISYTDYHYWHGQFIKMRNDVAGSGKVLGIAYYIFKGDKLIDSSSALMKPVPADTVLKRANALKKRFEEKS